MRGRVFLGIPYVANKQEESDESEDTQKNKWTIGWFVQQL